MYNDTVDKKMTKRKRGERVKNKKELMETISLNFEKSGAPVIGLEYEEDLHTAQAESDEPEDTPGADDSR